MGNHAVGGASELTAEGRVADDGETAVEPSDVEGFGRRHQSDGALRQSPHSGRRTGHDGFG